RSVANISCSYHFSLRSAVRAVYNKGRSLSSPRRDAMFCLLLLGLVFEPPSKVDWPALVQKPNARVAVQDLGLRPLLERDGKKITTRAGWEKARQALRAEWMKRLGEPPTRPEKLDAFERKPETLDGYSRQLVPFPSEGDDFIRAWLLLPFGLKEGEKRPAVVVFHPTTRDTLDEPAGLGKRKDMALAVHLARLGYVTLSPECYIL